MERVGILIIAGVLFGIGVMGIAYNRRNLILILASIELMLLGVNMNFIVYAGIYGNMTGQIIALLVITVAAADTAIGLAIIVIYSRVTETVEMRGMTGILAG
jgi:NADH-quinone oxidoreductase subunit K